MATISVQELREKQKELCDSFILDTDKMDEIMRKHTQKMVQGEFHNYSINNILLADFQLYMRTKETTELLSPHLLLHYFLLRIHNLPLHYYPSSTLLLSIFTKNKDRVQAGGYAMYPVYR